MKYIKHFENVKETIKVGDTAKIVKYNRYYQYKKEVYIGIVMYVFGDKSINMNVNTVLYYNDDNEIFKMDNIHNIHNVYYFSKSESKRSKKLSEKDLDEINTEIENFKIKNDTKKYNL